jgi:DNA-binding NarL/FixJ family response regulator
MAIRVLLADDHEVFRYGLKTAFAQEKAIEVVGEARDGHGAADLTRELSPDVVLMDIEMPGLNGIDATRRIIHDSPRVKVIGLSMHSSRRLATEMFNAGASGYLPKDCTFEELTEAITTVAAGGRYASPAVVGTGLQDRPRDQEPAAPDAFAALTAREREVLQLLAEGKSTKQIGQALFISPKTVEVHKLRIMSKLGIDNVASLTKYAIQQGLTSVE